ncbi:MAG: right-handed parallel beta-helix repeat-containing protein, partial [Spirochaetia bacterium]|nr:right-handed parallel beta-helix repeat-containing protein [Spirochaetia bacterium]
MKHTNISRLLVLTLTLLFAGRSAWSEAGQFIPLQKQIDEAMARGENRLRLPKGRLLVDTSGIVVRNATNFTLEGSGKETVLVCTNPSVGFFAFFNCAKIAVKNLSVDYDPLPFTQATVVSVSPDHLFFEYEIHAGFPLLTPFYALKTAYFFDPKTRYWKRHVPDVYLVSNTILSPTRGQLYRPTRPRNIVFDYSDIVPGDLVAFCNRIPAAFVFRGSESVRLEDVEVLGAGGGALCRNMRGENYFRFNIRRGPRPAGASQDRLMASSADGFNYAVAPKGPILERCDFSYMGDDSVNFHGSILPVM